jgi:hypothetical protein
MTTGGCAPGSRRDDAQFYWDWAKHEENLLTNRGNFFLVAQSMLLAGVAALWAGDSNPIGPFCLLFCALGVATSTVWLRVGLLHHTQTRAPLRAKLRDSESRIKLFHVKPEKHDVELIECWCCPDELTADNAEGQAGCLCKQSNYLMSVWLPRIVLFAWLGLAALVWIHDNNRRQAGTERQSLALSRSASLR